ncbi:MAG: 16S rRNA (cytosine(967)-C(5))-methyltransferase RsmB [Nitrospirota bacterium]|nr:16S rRNA (cytosine(967)-C(5))-methyltransferase RsmB [Nitrospirota bacterium]
MRERAARRPVAGAETVDMVRIAVVKALGRVGREGSFAAECEAFLGRPDPAAVDKAFFQEIAYGVLRNRSVIDLALASFLKGDLPSLPVPVLNTLRAGAYQLLFMDRVPASAAVNESVKIARKLGHAGTAGLVNAVLRRVSEKGREIVDGISRGESVPSLAMRYSHPEWLVSRWVNRYGAEKAERLLAADNEVPPLTLRVNRLKGTRDELISKLREEGIACEPTSVAETGIKVTGGNPFGTSAFRQGWFSVQDEGGQLVSLLLAPESGDTVIDLCAAPGGKATHLAEMMGDRGRVVAVDNHAKRLEKVAEAAGRLGLRAIAPMVADASLPDLQSKTGFADRVLVDVPCSGLGVLRRHPEARWEKKLSDLDRLKGRQLAILKGAASCLREGGSLVYATCSTEPEENMELVGSFLRDSPGMTVESPLLFLPAAAHVFVKNGLCLDTAGNDAGMDGFFAVRLVKGDK